MPKIRLIKVHRIAGPEDYWGNLDSSFVHDALSPWQEVTDQELDLLRSFESKDFFKDENCSLVIYEDIEAPIGGYVADIKEYLKKTEEKKKAALKKAENLKQQKQLNTKHKLIKKAQKDLERAELILRNEGLL